MNSGLPNLLDAIFGKKDLASVSLDEIYEVINEFPSFNAGHLLLSKKLKQQSAVVYEKENMRTALYFNNAFWLQTLLDEEPPMGHTEMISPVLREEDPFRNETITTSVFTPTENELDEEAGAILDEKFESEPIHDNATVQFPEAGSETVSSFDELMSKYKIDPTELIAEPVPEIITVSTEESEVKPEVEPEVELSVEQDVEPVAELAIETVPIPESIEGNHEVLNEYGIFEEVFFKDSDHDTEAFDRPFEPAMDTPEETVNVMTTVESSLVAESPLPQQTEEKEEASIVENQRASEEEQLAVERDYEAFDRPLEKKGDLIETEYPEESFIYRENSYDFGTVAADDTEIHSANQEAESQMPPLSERFGEQQKSAAFFDGKKTKEIVFAPYHMIDYFASQGIKLVLEDQPLDSFGKQLKSFTDWLKVMKKLPAQPLSERTEEKEADRIRHFAAHSVEERDILTETMAEVLAKQGMYENAIALYQKLSLIYPPKSAYFASRIEQLKASLS